MVYRAISILECLPWAAISWRISPALALNQDHISGRSDIESNVAEIVMLIVERYKTLRKMERKEGMKTKPVNMISQIFGKKMVMRQDEMQTGNSPTVCLR